MVQVNVKNVKQSSQEIGSSMFKSKCVCRMRRLRLTHSEFSWLGYLAYPSGHLVVYIFLNILSSTYRPTQMSLTVDCYIDRCSLERFFHYNLSIWLSDDPAFLDIWIVTEVWTNCTWGVPSPLDFRDRACSTGIISKPALLDLHTPCKVVMRGWMLRANSPIASGSPCVVP